MSQFDVKLVKWGLIFFTEPATLKLEQANVEVIKQDGTAVLASSFTELKKANFNSINGMWTLVAGNGQKCNVIVKDEQANNELTAGLTAAGVKGLTV